MGMARPRERRVVMAYGHTVMLRTSRRVAGDSPRRRPTVEVTQNRQGVLHGSRKPSFKLALARATITPAFSVTGY